MGKLLLNGIAVTLNGVGRALVYSYDVSACGVQKVCSVAKKTPSTMGKVKRRYLCRVCRGSHRACNRKCNMAGSWGSYPPIIDKKAKKVGIRGELLATEMRRNDYELFSYAAKMREELPYNRERQVTRIVEQAIMKASMTYRMIVHGIPATLKKNTGVF